MKTHKIDERRKKLFSEHGHNSLKAYEHESLKPKSEKSPVEHKAKRDVEGYKARVKPAKSKIEKTMHEYKEHELHSGSKKGPLVTNRRQAIAISLSQARKEGAHIPKKHKK